MPPLKPAMLLIDLAEVPVRIPLPTDNLSIDHLDRHFVGQAPSEYIGLARLLLPSIHAARLKRAGQRLKAQRLAAGLSKGQAARLCGVSRREYGRWEAGEERAPEGMMERIGGDTSASLRPACSPSVEPLRVSPVPASPAIAEVCK